MTTRGPTPEGVLVLLRHGRTAWNVEGRFLGRSDVGLDEVGLAQVRDLALARAGVFGRVYSSPALRALQTAAGLAPPEPIAVAGLVEVDQGELEGLRYPEALARWPDFFASWAVDPGRTRVPGGETLEEARDRVVAALDALAPAEDGRPTAVVTHQLAAAALLCTVRGRPLADWRAHRLDHVQEVRLVRRAGGWVEVGGGGPPGV